MARILIVDDSVSARQHIAEILGDRGHSVFKAADGLEALSLTAEQKPDLIVLDLLMPDMDGFDVLKALADREYCIPVVVLSADIQETTRTECIRLGAAGFMNKPVDAEDMVEAVQQLLDDHTVSR